MASFYKVRTCLWSRSPRLLCAIEIEITARPDRATRHYSVICKFCRESLSKFLCENEIRLLVKRIRIQMTYRRVTCLPLFGKRYSWRTVLLHFSQCDTNNNPNLCTCFRRCCGQRRPEACHGLKTSMSRFDTSIGDTTDLKLRPPSFQRSPLRS